MEPGSLFINSSQSFSLTTQTSVSTQTRSDSASVAKISDISSLLLNPEEINRLDNEQKKAKELKLRDEIANFCMVRYGHHGEFKKVKPQAQQRLRANWDGLEGAIFAKIDDLEKNNVKFKVKMDAIRAIHQSMGELKYFTLQQIRTFFDVHRKERCERLKKILVPQGESTQ